MNQIDDLLHDLAQRVEPPRTPLAEDLARGRRRLRRRRLAGTGAALAVACALGAGTLLGQGMLDAGGPGPDPATNPSDTVTESAGAVRERAVDPVPAGSALAPYADDFVLARPVLAAWRDVLVERLDPDGSRIQPYDGNSMTNGREDLLVSLGADYGWAEPGDPGLGFLTLEVSRNARSSDTWACGTHGFADGRWECQAPPEPPAGTTRAEAATKEGARGVAVQRADGQVVALRWYAHWSNNSPVGLSADGPSLEELLEVAADPRLVLELDRTAPEPAVDPDTFAQAGADQLAWGEGEVRLYPSRPSVHHAQWVVDDEPGADLNWVALPVEADAPGVEATCIRGRHEQCRIVDVDGQEVLVATRKGVPEGWDVLYRGETHLVQVRIERSEDGPVVPAELVTVAARFVVDPRWQPPR